MSGIRRHDLTDRANVTDEAQTFKKPYQTVDRPPVTDHDINEEYLNDAPQVRLSVQSVQDVWHASMTISPSRISQNLEEQHILVINQLRRSGLQKMRNSSRTAC